MVTTSQTPPQPFTLVIGDDPVYSLDTDRRRIGFGTRQPQRRVHVVTPDATVARFESTGAVSPLVELVGSGGSGTLGYNSATGQFTFGTDLEATDTHLAVDVLSVPDGGLESARVQLGDDGDIKLFWNGVNGELDYSSGTFYFRRNGVTAFRITASAVLQADRGLTVNTTALRTFKVEDATGKVSVSVANGSDAQFNWDISGTVVWGMGVDASDSNNLVLGRSGTLGTSTVMRVLASNQMATFVSGIVPPVVADATAQASLATSAGALSFRQSDSKLCVYNGSAWTAVH